MNASPDHAPDHRPSHPEVSYVVGDPLIVVPHCFFPRCSRFRIFQEAVARPYRDSLVRSVLFYRYFGWPLRGRARMWPVPDRLFRTCAHSFLGAPPLGRRLSFCRRSHLVGHHSHPHLCVPRDTFHFFAHIFNPRSTTLVSTSPHWTIFWRQYN